MTAEPPRRMAPNLMAYSESHRVEHDDSDGCDTRGCSPLTPAEPVPAGLDALRAALRCPLSGHGQDRTRRIDCRDDQCENPACVRWVECRHPSHAARADLDRLVAELEGARQKVADLQATVEHLGAVITTHQRHRVNVEGKRRKWARRAEAAEAEAAALRTALERTRRGLWDHTWQMDEQGRGFHAQDVWDVVNEATAALAGARPEEEKSL